MRRGRVLLIACLSLALHACDDEDKDDGITPPSDMAVTSMSPTQIVVSWYYADTGAVDGFRVYRDDGGGFAELGTVSGLTGYADSTVASGSTYTYYVVAYIGLEESAPSAQVIVAAEAPSITVIQPNGSETLTIGTQYNVTWQTNCPYLDARVMVSTDGGFSLWTEIVSSGGVSPFAWTVGNDYTGAPFITGTETNCIVRVRQYDDPALADDSDGAFTVQP